MHIIIIGSGKTGKYVIEMAVKYNHEVYVIEKDKAVADWAASHFDCVVINADATSIESLKEAKADRADAIIVTTNDDATNMLIILLARQLGVKRLVSSLNNEDHLPLFEQLGIDTIESPYRINGKYLYRAVHGANVKEFLDLGNGFEILELEVAPHSVIDGKLVKEINKQRLLPKNSRILIIKRENHIVVPEGETRVIANDVVGLITHRTRISQLAELFG